MFGIVYKLYAQHYNSRYFQELKLFFNIFYYFFLVERLLLLMVIVAYVDLCVVAVMKSFSITVV